MNYPQGRAVEVFRSFHFDLEVKNRPECSGLYFAPPGIAKIQFRPPLREGAIGNPDAEHRGIL